MRRPVVLGALVVILAIAVVAWRLQPHANAPVPSSTPSAGVPSGAARLLVGRTVGDPPKGEERPQISNVAIADLDRDGLNDILVCDALRGTLSWIRQAPKGTFTEQTIAGVAAAAHVQVVDVDKDGDNDLLVASLGGLFPNNNRIGAVIVFENDGQQHFKSHYIADRVARVADARAADLDGDGDLDVTAAGFGYDDGETSWLENKGQWKFEQHVLQRLSGPINAIPTDLDGNSSPDIVALVSQEWEEIWGFVNDGRGTFMPRMLWGSTNPDFGSSWISVVDLDRDGDPDILYANGDAFEYAPPNSRPWQGIQWLENRGKLQFEFHRLIDLQGATSPEAADLDGDGDLDMLAVVSNNDWDNPQVPSLIWLENDGHQKFTMHPIASSPTHLLTVAIGDLDGDGKPDAATGGMHISRPYDRIGRITAWFRPHP